MDKNFDVKAMIKGIRFHGVHWHIHIGHVSWW